MIRVLFIFTLLALSSSVHAFNWRKCSNHVFFRGNGGGMLVSTTSFFSSTGECSMIGQSAHDKKVFLAQNFEELKTDSARGGGEYLSAYATLSGCTPSSASELSKSIQQNFTLIYGKDISKTPEAVYEAMERMIQSDLVLASGCLNRS